MTTEMITLKLEHHFLQEIDTAVKKQRYHNRTEFIRQALREKIEKEELKHSLAALEKLRGSSKRKTTDEEYETARENAFERWSKALQ